MKRKLQYNILLLFMFCLICPADNATFSIARILLFHPEMQNYHFGLHTFFRQPIKPENKNNFISELYKELSIVEKQRQNHIVQLRIERQNKIEQQKNINYAHIAEIKKEYTEKIREYSTNILNKQKELFFRHFLNPEERNKKMQAILREIDEITADVQQKMRINFLFHDSLQHKIPAEITEIFSPDQENYLYNLQNPELWLNQTLSNINDSKRLLNLHQPHGLSTADFTFGIDQESVSLYLRKYTNQGPYRAIFTTGPDITGKIMMNIYRKHHLPEMMAERLSEIKYIPDSGLRFEK